MSSPPAQPAIVLLSGGLDSATTLAAARNENRSCICLSFDYSQRHNIELKAAANIAKSLDAQQHIIMPLNLRLFGSSALTDNIPVPKDRDQSKTDHDIPITYVPARNLIFLSVAAALAEAQQASEVWIGVNAIDYSGYPDCRPEFIESFQQTLNLATKVGVQSNQSTPAIRIRTPLADLTKSQVISLAANLGVDLAQTHSCYDPSPTGLACAHCDSCLLRRQGFQDANIPDPTNYASTPNPTT